MRNPIKISIIVPSYNQAVYLEETLNSITEQGYDNVEILVIDGASTDHTVDVIKIFEEKIAYWVSEKDKGQSEAINKGLAKATGDVITWLNSDDLYEKDTLAKVADIFSNPSIDVICGDCYFFYEGNPSQDYVSQHGEISFDRTIQYWKTNPPAIPPQPSVFLRKKVWDKIGGVDESLRYGMDYDLWLRVLEHFQIQYVPELFSRYRFHTNSKSHSDDGFLKFHREWHYVFLKALQRRSFFTRLKHQLEYGLFYYDWKYNKSQLLLQYIFKGFIKKSRF